MLSGRLITGYPDLWMTAACGSQADHAEAIRYELLTNSRVMKGGTVLR
jgi:hypothetical protein